MQIFFIVTIRKFSCEFLTYSVFAKTEPTLKDQVFSVYLEGNILTLDFPLTAMKKIRKTLGKIDIQEHCKTFSPVSKAVSG